MGGKGGSESLLTLVGELLNSAVSFLIFSFLDVLDVVLCVVYKLIDYAIEAEWKPCYCSSAKSMVNSSGSFLVSLNRGPKVVRLCSAKLQLEDVSDTLYSRPSRVSEFSRKAAVAVAASTSMSVRSPAPTTSFAVSSNVMEMLKGKIDRRRRPQPIPLWSDCDCKICNSWSRSPSNNSQLYVHAEGGAADGTTTTNTDVLFIHGFISSSTFWTETVFQEFTEETRSRHRLFAVDLLGFGRSPKPADSLYTLREHIEMIEKSVLERYNVRSFHIVAHSLGCIIALALAVRHPDAVKSLTLLAPPYFPVPRGEEPTQFIMRRVAPRKVWPAIAFGASMACWYEHVSRTICLLICKNHRLWDFLFRFFTGNRIRTFMIEVFMCHTHNAAWHTLHNVICASAEKMESYLRTVREKLSCDVRIFHGDGDELLPVECSYDLAAQIPRASVKVFEKKDHVTILVGQQRAFARELEEVWRSADYRS
ncbi:putative lysophospholipase BODYGUARD 2 [Canna indica]|uniref:Lysophospholipase BODYGUARD 2 n=1 Tax=Canna indica TaxID=4628 RepID=A0AAQ3Q1Y5_9LILI|nr:putative lysophospholipase BODYGUARD 2 [Canna indica]